jgi:hypothetical protein
VFKALAKPISTLFPFINDISFLEQNSVRQEDQMNTTDMRTVQYTHNTKLSSGISQPPLHFKSSNTAWHGIQCQGSFQGKVFMQIYQLQRNWSTLVIVEESTCQLFISWRTLGGFVCIKLLAIQCIILLLEECFLDIVVQKAMI